MTSSTLTRTEDFKYILSQIEDGIGTITLNRPDRLNSIKDSLAHEVERALDLLEKDQEVKVVIIKGAGEHFSAGVDLKEAFNYPSPIGEQPSEVWRAHLESLLRVSIKLWSLKKLTIAAVSGHALGGAADWVLSTDLAIASNEAKFGEPEIRFGAAPPTLMMPWVVGIRKAKELLLTGDILDAYEAKEAGIFNKVVEKEQLETEVTGLARRISKLPSSAVKLTKRSVNKTYEIQGLRDALDYNVEVAISMFFLNTETEIEGIGSLIKNEGLKGFLDEVSKQVDN
ncbi:enoyl-CoA hydratase/isomerase family protein [Pseudalkalibacillus berkeleyi]|uniref:Enoyl-CoA hydratase/isomerase family protein n=1 Tax=Pseudalkalibacillus berkeleyi TaxID=1069813 RepID=A0ABS9H0P9_9BACL|nr:enoyl-CoA hydratase/isomerase family protein [Pseudalkalibacillus berkeleyi]MCF6137520.1 enoyl-CoA hydratase/isomerase family protein [Pseudalkalibacillus berkeleyi]